MLNSSARRRWVGVMSVSMRRARGDALEHERRSVQCCGFIIHTAGVILLWVGDSLKADRATGRLAYVLTAPEVCEMPPKKAARQSRSAGRISYGRRAAMEVQDRAGVATAGLRRRPRGHRRPGMGRAQFAPSSLLDIPLISTVLLAASIAAYEGRDEPG